MLLLIFAVLFHVSHPYSIVIVTVSGHLIRRIFRKHLFINACMLLLIFAVLFQVSHPHSKTDLTFDSNIRIFVFRDKYPALHILFN
jgi:hypothetical protein